MEAKPKRVLLLTAQHFVFHTAAALPPGDHPEESMANAKDRLAWPCPASSLCCRTLDAQRAEAGRAAVSMRAEGSTHKSTAGNLSFLNKYLIDTRYYPSPFSLLNNPDISPGAHCPTLKFFPQSVSSARQTRTSAASLAGPSFGSILRSALGMS